MFGLFTKSTIENSEDAAALDEANYNLSCRVEALLEQEQNRKMRFANFATTPSYYR